MCSWSPARVPQPRSASSGTPSLLDDINPEAIDHIEILKGAAAATLYGTEASAGVIQIFTKSGSRGSPRWDFMSEQGFSNYPEGRYAPNAGWVLPDELAAARSRSLNLPVPTAPQLSAFSAPPRRPSQIVERPFAKGFSEPGSPGTFWPPVGGGPRGATY